MHLHCLYRYRQKGLCGSSNNTKHACEMSCVPDESCRSGLSPLLGFLRPPAFPPDSGRMRSGIRCYLGGPGEEQREGGAPEKPKKSAARRLSCYGPSELRQLRGRRQHYTSQPESRRKMRKDSVEITTGGPTRQAII